MTPTIIDLHTLPSLPLDQRNKLPNTAGVYFVVAPNDAVLYISQAVSLVRRWHNIESGTHSAPGNVALHG